MRIRQTTLRCVAERHSRRAIPALVLAAIAGVCLPACESSTPPKSDSELQSDIVSQMHTLVMKDMTMLLQAARDLQSAAPDDVAGGWDSSANPASQQACTRTPPA